MIELVSKEQELMEDRAVRDQLAVRVEVLGKVKALALLPDGLNATVEMAANYYEVGKQTIVSLIHDNRAEIESDGMKVLSGAELNSFKEMGVIGKNSASFTIIPRRALLRIGMLLRDSEVAKTVRSYLLNVEEIAQEEAPQVVAKAIRRTQRTPWASIEKAIRFKAKIGQTLGLTPATAQLLAIEHTEKEFGVDLTVYKKQLPGDDPARVFSPTELGKELGLSAVKINELLEQAGLQMRAITGKKDGKDKWGWQVTEKGKAFAKLIPVVVKEGKVDVTKYTVRWHESVLGVLRNE